MSEQRQGSNSELVKIAYAQDGAQAAMIQGLLENAGIPSISRELGINGPQLGFGLLVSNPQRVMVRAGQAEQARALLAEALVEDPQEASQAEIPDSGRPSGREPRNYGLIGAFARSYLVAIGVFAVAFGVFLLLRVS